jgi:hypothetical protein
LRYIPIATILSLKEEVERILFSKEFGRLKSPGVDKAHVLYNFIL